MGLKPPALPLTREQFQQELQCGYTAKEIARRWHMKRHGIDKPNTEKVMKKLARRSERRIKDIHETK